MTNKNIKTSFTAETRSFEQELKKMETLLTKMKTTMGAISKTSTKTSGVMDKSFKKSEKTIKGMGNEMTGTEKIAKVLQGQLSNVGKMPQIASSQKTLTDFKGGLSDIDKVSQGLDKKLTPVGDLPKMEHSIPLLGRFVNGLSGIESETTNTGQGIDRLGDVVEKLGGGFGKLPSVAKTAFSSVGSAITGLTNITSSTLNTMVSSFNKGFNNMSKKATGALNGISSKFSRLGKSGDSLIGTVKNLAGAFTLVSIGQKALDKLTSSMDGAIKRYDTLKNANKVFENMGFEAGATAKMMDSLTKSLDGIPTSADDAIQNIMRISMANNDIQKAGKLFEHLNYAVLATGKGAEDVNSTVEMFSRAIQRGTMNGHEWDAMMRNMGPAMNNMADMMGISINDLQEGLKDGTISFGQFEDALHELAVNGNGDFASLEQQARDMTDGIGTAISNLGSRIQAGIVDGILKPLDAALEKNGLPTIAGMINNASANIRDSIKKLSGSMPKLVEIFKEIGTVGVVSLLAIPTVLPTILRMLGTLGVGFGGLGDTLTKVPEKAKGAFESVTKSIGKVPSKISGVAKSISGYMSKIPGFDFISGKLSGGISGASNAIKGLVGKIPGFDVITKGLGAVTGKLGVFTELLKPIGSIATTVLGAVGNAFLSMAGVAMSALAPTAIIGVLLASLGMVNDAFGEQINTMLTYMKENGQKIIGNLVEGIMEKLPALIQSGAELVANLLDAINVNLPAVFEAGMTILTGIIHGVLENLDIILPAVLDIISTLAHGVLTAIPDLLLLGMEILAGLVQGIIDNMPEIMTVSMQIIGDFIAKIGENLPKILDLGFEMLVNLVGGLRESLPQMIEFAGRVIPDLITGIMEKLPDILIAGLEIILMLVDVLLENLPAIIQTGIEIIISLVIGILEALPYIVVAVLEAIAKFNQTIIESLPDIFMMGVKMIWELIKGIGQGVLELGKSAVDSVGDLWGRIRGKSKEGSEDTKDAALEQTGLMVEGTKSDLYAIEGSVSEHGTILSQGMSDSWSGIELDVSRRTGNIRNTTISDFGEASTSVLTDTERMRGGVKTEYGGLETDLSIYTSDIRGNTIGDFTATRQGVGTEIDTMSRDVTSRFGDIADEATNAGSNIASGTDSGFKDASDKQKYHMNMMLSTIKNFTKTMNTLMTSAMNRLASTMGSGMNKARAIMRSQTSGMVIILRNMYSGFYSAGTYAMVGLQAGLNSRRGSVLATARGIANSVTSTVRRALRIHSPSRVMEQLGSYTGEGFDDGLSTWISRVSKTADRISDAVVFDANLEEMANAFMDSVISTQHEVTGVVDNQVSGSVEYYRNDGGAPQPLNLTIQTPVTDWKLYVEDITEEQNAQIRRGRY